MRPAIQIALPLIVAAIVAAIICRFVGPAAHCPQMIVAATVALLAAEAALVPLLLGRGLPKALSAQAGLLATVVHLLSCLVGGGLAAVLSNGPNRVALLLWLLPFYWISLSALIINIVRTIRAAPVDGANPAPATTSTTG